MLKIKEAPLGASLYKKPFSMALISPEDQMVHLRTGCRDYLHDIIKAHVNGKRISKNQFCVDCYYKPGSSAPDVCMDRLRLMITLYKEQDSFIGNAMRTLNIIENYLEIAPSTIEKVYHPSEGKHYLVEGVGEYVQNPHMLSALTFILRFIVKNALGDPINSAKAFIGKIDECEEKVDLHSYSDRVIALKCRDKFLKVLKNRAQIFAGITQQEFYPAESSESFHSQGGIACLCQGHTHNHIVNERVMKL